MTGTRSRTRRSVAMLAVVALATVGPRFLDIVADFGRAGRDRSTERSFVAALQQAFARADAGRADRDDARRRHRRVADDGAALLMRRGDLRNNFANPTLDVLRFSRWAATSNDADSAWLAADRALYRSVVRIGDGRVPPPDTLGDLARFARIDVGTRAELGSALVILANVLTGRDEARAAFTRDHRFDSGRALAWAALLPESDPNHEQLGPHQRVYEQILNRHNTFTSSR